MSPDQMTLDGLTTLLWMQDRYQCEVPLQGGEPVLTRRLGTADEAVLVFSTSDGARQSERR